MRRTTEMTGETAKRSLPQRFVAEWKRHSRSWGMYAAATAFLFSGLAQTGVLHDALALGGPFDAAAFSGLMSVACALALFFAATASGLNEGDDDHDSARPR